MAPHGNIYLVGMMGAGKTTAGRKLAHLLHYDFIDIDQVLEKRTGVPIGHIFEIEGEQGFREREAKLLAETSANTDTVISTGGGIILREENRIVMRKHGVVVYLRASTDLLWERIKNGDTRPLLNAPDAKTKLVELLEMREPLYVTEADMVVDVNVESSAVVAQRIHALL